MAKGKHSTALFEVIHSARKPERVAQSLRTPKWWFKSRHSRVSSAASPADPTCPQREPSNVSPSDPTSRPTHYESGRSSAVHVDFDASRKEVTFRLRYTTVLVSAFGICVLVGMSYVVGRHLGRGPQPASAAEPQPSIGQLMLQPPQPGVTNVAKPHTSGQNATAAAATHHNSPPTNVQPKPEPTSKLVPASAYTQLPRKPGLNYALISIYPTEERAKAEAARDFLVSHGISCTLEKTGWAPSWISLVGTAGFPKASDPDFKIYTANILKVSADMKTSAFEKPQPTGYSWKGPPTDRGL
jgi:hypothetical protein